MKTAGWSAGRKIQDPTPRECRVRIARGSGGGHRAIAAALAMWGGAACAAPLHRVSPSTASIASASGAPVRIVQDTARTTVGVAFGGGSARGIAHVGVIRWFEEHRIPIDVAAGTSMDGLVGGAFATGMDAGERQAFITTLNWDDLRPQRRVSAPDRPDFVGGPVHAGGWLENGDAFDEWSSAHWRINGSVGLFMDTLVGPVVVAGSWGFDGRWRTYIGVGRTFR